MLRVKTGQKIFRYYGKKLLLFFLQRVLKITIPTNTLVLLIKHGMKRGLRSPQFQIRSPPPPPPFSLSISLCAEGLNLPSIDNPLYDHPPHTHFLYFFRNTCFWQDFSDNITPTHAAELFLHFNKIKNQC